MIFVTVGTQFPFPRLVNAIAELDLDEKVVAQVGSDSGVYPFETADFMRPEAFEEAAQQARVIVAHAGMGSVLAARRWSKPLILMPRRADFGEHRNDHQLATARQLWGRVGVDIAWSEKALGGFLACPLTGPQTGPTEHKQQLLAQLQDFVSQSSVR
ncbi:glycosyltransferase [Actibacterium pelagium]|uniref:glycosyltransferase n=1 Tax=Actibacterium pelagium TaxID=2029103 RepID=UPI000BAB074A|nr:glycosyltransferase [Actibacterium pelagium]